MITILYIVYRKSNICHFLPELRIYIRNISEGGGGRQLKQDTQEAAPLNKALVLPALYVHVFEKRCKP